MAGGEEGLKAKRLLQNAAEGHTSLLLHFAGHHWRFAGEQLLPVSSRWEFEPLRIYADLRGSRICAEKELNQVPGESVAMNCVVPHSTRSETQH